MNPTKDASGAVKVAGPVPVTAESGEPFGGAESPVGLTETPLSDLLRDHDFVEEEFFVSGTVGGQPYTTSLLIRRPATVADFSGLVALEPVHVQGALGLWQTCHPTILADGHAWVTVGSQLAAVEGPIRLSNPSRYASLHVPSAAASEESFAALMAWQQGDDANPPRTLFAIDAISNEIMTQVGVLLKAGSEDGPLPGFAVEHLIMGGASQTGMATLNYIEASHPNARLSDGKPVYDGFLPMAAPGWTPVAGGDAAVVHTFTEGDLFLFGVIGPDGAVAARPDGDAPNDRYRSYQVPACPHLPTRGLRDVDGIPQLGLTLEPGERLNQFPSAPFNHAAFVHLVNWVTKGVVPPRAAPIEIAKNAVVSDEFGNAKGGIRSPYVDVPTARYIPARYLRNLIGVELPFGAGELGELYGSRAGYLTRFNQSIDEAIKAGSILPADGDQLKMEEAESAPL
ncbi:hypothetical protein FraEuI1c_4104 [Pseudofrankia inefficax]|uniref:Alpha/beta hydrolase domain-containing protein n=1 Tax=Pseudofrankia inefficax (strain DSM 45817 / CECT 9037 / DDB 130130 / EuI1c) TaxID=298654 RepID=E3J986_PSEI1|nr:hypothetical protein FraEuI1c_4104 [Pseudofrankia inefficax]